MSIITKAIATEVALKLTAKKQEEIKKLDDELRIRFEHIYLKYVPLEIQDGFEKHPNYFNISQSVQISGNGFNWQSLYFTKKLPKVSGGFNLNEKDSVLLLKKYNEIEDKKTECRNLIHEIETALTGLRSYKKISESFPEAVPFLTERITSALAINITEIQQKLK